MTIKTPDAQDFANWIIGLKLARAAILARQSYESAMHRDDDFSLMDPDDMDEYFEAQDREYRQEVELIDAAIKALEPLAEVQS